MNIKFRAILIVGIASVQLIHAEGILVPLVTTNLVMSGDQAITQFKHIDFLKVSDKQTICYATALINDQWRAIKILNIQGQHIEWVFEKKFKNTDIEFFGLLGTQKVCITSSGDIWLTQRNAPWRLILKFKKYKDETIISCTGKSGDDFYITTLDKKTNMLTTLHMTKKAGDKDFTLTSIPQGAPITALTKDGAYKWSLFFDKQSKKSTLEIADLTEDESFAQTIPLEGIDVARVYEIIPVNNEEAFFVSPTSNILYAITNEGDLDKKYESTEPVGVFGETPVITIGSMLYKYEERAAQPHIAPKIEEPIIKAKPVRQEEILQGMSKQTAKPNAFELPAIKLGPIPIRITETKPDSTKKLSEAATSPNGEKKSMAAENLLSAATRKSEHRLITAKNTTKTPSSLPLPEHQDFLARLAQIKTSVKKAVENALQKALFKNQPYTELDPLEYEVQALKTDPKPWEGFLQLSYYDRARNLFNRIMGRMDYQTSIIQNRFGSSPAGIRAHLLYELWKVFGNENYRGIWLQEAEWLQNIEQVGKIQKKLGLEQLNFGQYWLKPIQESQTSLKIRPKRVPIGRSLS